MTAPALSVQDVVKDFADLRAVDCVGFDVRPGEVFGFLGPNGAGKTTTLRMIMGIIRPDSGAIQFDGGSTLDRARVGYLPEERGLFEDAEVLDTLLYLGTLRGMARRDARTAALGWLDRLELADRAKGKLGTLSKGNQQKVQFVGAILHHPALAVLDEPFSGLDPLNQELFIKVVRELRQEGAAVLVSSHQLDLVERLCDRFYLISRGAAVLSGTLDELRRQVAGGARDVLELVLRAAGAAPVAEVGPAIEQAAPGLERRIEPAGDGAVRVELTLRPGADLNEILAGLCARFTIERVQTRPLPLHEIYLRAVGAGPDESAAGARELAGV